MAGVRWLDPAERPMRLRGVAGMAAAALLAVIGCSDGSSEASTATTAPASTGPVLVSATLPAEAMVEQVAAAGGAGWLSVSAEDALFRMATDGETMRVRAFDGFHVQSMVAFGPGLVVAGIRCERERQDSSLCGGVPQVRATDPDGRERWQLDLPNPDPDGHAALRLLGSTAEAVWVRAPAQRLLAIDRSGEVVEEISADVTEECLIGDRIYGLAPAVSARQPDPGVPPTASVAPGETQVDEILVERLNGSSWQPAPGGATVVEGAVPLARCANDGFEVSGTIDELPTQRWTPRDGRWMDLEPPVGRDPLAGPPAATTTGTEFQIDREDGQVLRRAPDAVSYEPVGVTLETQGLGQPGTHLRVGEDGDTVFACISPAEEISCGFGRRGP